MPFFSYISYAEPGETGYPFNSYAEYDINWPWFSYYQPSELLQYYSNLLRLQYKQSQQNVSAIQALVSPILMDQLPLQVQNGFNLNPTIQTLSFSDVAASGSFVLTYNGNNSGSISWDADLSDIQLQANNLLGVGQVIVSGSITRRNLVFSWQINQVPLLLSVSSNTLEDSSSSPITISTSTNQAVGVQLDILGKYVGVSRNTVGSNGPISLADDEFLQLIQLAILRNQEKSDLATIVNGLYRYFPNQIFVFDYANTSPMSMSYFINTSVTSEILLQAFIAEGLLPQPMGVGVSIIAAPVIDNFFGYCDYVTATPTQPNTNNSEPYNCFSSYTSGDYNTDWLYLDYSNSITI